MCKSGRYFTCYTLYDVERPLYILYTHIYNLHTDKVYPNTTLPRNRKLSMYHEYIVRRNRLYVFFCKMSRYSIRLMIILYNISNNVHDVLPVDENT